ncbi:MAG: gephyrin-like molybdotransferase Glp [Actinomycetota bacterium]
MIPLEEAQNYVLETVQRLGTERIGLLKARDRVASEPITSSESIPPFDNTAVDGYAVIAADTQGASNNSPATLTVLESIAAGTAPEKSIKEGECSKIMTGAPIPDGANAVVMVEWSEPGTSENHVNITKAVSAGDHIRKSGEDLLPDDLVIPEETFLNPAHIGLLASVGIYEIETFRKPKVAVFSTGDELIEGSQSLEPGQIRDSNRFSLIALLERDGFQAVDFGLIADDESAIEETIQKATKTCDAIITTGGVSMGDYDFVKIVLSRIGDMRWMQIAIKPAKPFAFGIVNEIPVFGLPGNPVSSMVSYELLTKPALKKMMGRVKVFPTFLKGETVGDFKRREDGKTHFVRAIASLEEMPPKVYSARRQGSHQLTGMAEANALAVLPDGEGVPAGSSLQFFFLD